MGVGKVFMGVGKVFMGIEVVSFGIEVVFLGVFLGHELSQKELCSEPSL